MERGIPPFRGPGGLWGKHDPQTLEVDYFLAQPDSAWPVIREIFYDNFGKAKPNKVHQGLARLKNEGWPQTGEEDGRTPPGPHHPEHRQTALCAGELIAKQQPASSVNCQSAPA